MAYREVHMWEVLNVLRRIGRGESKSAVARATGHERRTIRGYVKAAEALGWVPGQAEPDEELALAVFRRVRPGPKARELGPAETLLLPHRETIRGQLEVDDSAADGLRLTKVHELLVRKGVEVSYPSLRRFAVKYCGFEGRRRRVTVRLPEVPPGDVAQIDFGRLGLISVAPGQRRFVHALIVTLVHSRHQYVHVSHTQALPDLLTGLEDAWEFFGGVPARVILDNLKAAVTKADRYAPVFQRTFEEYAAHRGFVIDAAVVASPTHKPHVERSVQYVRESFFRGEAWINLEHVQREVKRWVLEIAGMREHGTTRERPLEAFRERELDALLPLERPRFDPPSWRTDAKPHPDHNVVFEKATYTVPTKYIGKVVHIRGDSKLVRIYRNGELIKTHERQPPGGRAIDHHDYPDEKTPYTMRNVNDMILKARTRGENIETMMVRLLEGDFPWARLRQGQALIRLCAKYGPQRVDQACRRALAFDIVDVKRVERMLKVIDDLTPATDRTADVPDNVVQIPLRFQRPAGSFTHHIKQEGEKNETSRSPAVAEDCAETPAPVGNAPDVARPGGLLPKGEAE